MAFKKYLTWRNIIITTVIILVLSAIITYMSRAKTAVKKYKLLPKDSGGDIPEGWKPDAMAKQLFEAIDGIDSNENVAPVYAEFNLLNDNQMIETYNFWAENYADKQTWWGKKFGSLTRAIMDEWTKPKAADLTLANLKRLNLEFDIADMPEYIQQYQVDYITNRMPDEMALSWSKLNDLHRRVETRPHLM